MLVRSFALPVLVTVLFLFAGCSGSSPPAPTGPQQAVTIQNYAFNPANLTIAKGTTVTWTNKDGTYHTVTSDSGTELGSSPIQPNTNYKHTFSTPGVYHYHCKPHSTQTGSTFTGMTGTITVTA